MPTESLRASKRHRENLVASKVQVDAEKPSLTAEAGLSDTTTSTDDVPDEALSSAANDNEPTTGEEEAVESNDPKDADEALPDAA